MLSKIHSAGLSGLEGYHVSVEVDEGDGLPRSVIVGNVSPSVREALERCQVALKNSSVFLPPKRLTINLAPADRRKDGTFFDLAILSGVLKAIYMPAGADTDQYGFIGEIGLDGEIRHVNGILSLVSALKEEGLRGAIVPQADVQEALVVENMDIIGISHVTDLFKLLRSEDAFNMFDRPIPEKSLQDEQTYEADFSDVHGQSFGIRAALIAAAGGHNLLLSGVAGSGKTMIAKRIPSILPPLTREENIEVTRVYSASGLLPKGQALYNRRPFRTPHHTITTPALIGGSSPQGIMPGEIALATRGVLFLDEIPLFSRFAIEALREPMEEKRVVINRLQGSFTYPADCMVVAAMNPCPCGYYPDRNRCHCTEAEIRAYQKGISRPILERIDLCVEASPVRFEEAVSLEKGISSRELREKVQDAREIQKIRFKNTDIMTNAEMRIRHIRTFCKLGSREEEFIGDVFRLRGLSMRSYHKILKVARTIADLEHAEKINISHLSEAVSYRGLEDRLFGGGDMA